MGPTDAALTPEAGSQGDDRRARFESLVRSAYSPLQRYLRRRTDAAAADDVLGDVLLVMWRRFDEIPAEAALPWCYGVARGCLANAVRGTQRQRRLVDRLTSAAQAAGVGQVELYEDPELDIALAGMSEADRELLRLWAWEDLAAREIAVAMGITPNAVSIRLHRAARRLRERMTRKDGGVSGHLGQREGEEAPQ